jgi:hypothetical protein
MLTASPLAQWLVLVPPNRTSSAALRRRHTQRIAVDTVVVALIAATAAAATVDPVAVQTQGVRSAGAAEKTVGILRGEVYAGVVAGQAGRVVGRCGAVHLGGGGGGSSTAQQDEPVSGAAVNGLLLGKAGQGAAR